MWIRAPFHVFVHVMLVCSLLAGIFQLGPAPALASDRITADGATHINNSAEPSGGTHTLDLSELWRIGAGADDPIFGVIAKVLTDPDGNVLLLDKQQSLIWVLSPEGKLLRTLGRSGEGPGEATRPDDMLFLPDGRLGIVKHHPGVIVKLDLQGIPRGTFRLAAADRGMRSLDGAGCRAGSLVVRCQQMIPLGGAQDTRFYLSRVALDGAEMCRYFEKILHEDFEHFKMSELDEYFPKDRLWTIGPDGRVYVVSQRDRYLIHVYQPDGTIDRVIERTYRSLERPRREKQAARKYYTDMCANLPFDYEIEIADTRPDIERIHVDDDGMLWVLCSRGTDSQPAGILASYDVFDPTGDYIRQVQLECPGDGWLDEFFFLSDGRAILVTGAREAHLAMRGTPLNQDTEDTEPLQVICFKIGN